GAHPLRRQVGEGGAVVGGEAEHLAPAGGRPAGRLQLADRLQGVLRSGAAPGGQRGEAVLEGDHVVVGGGDLGRPVRGGRAERAGVAGRQVGAALAVRGHHHPLAQQRVEPGLRRGLVRRQAARDRGRFRPALRLVEVDDLAPVRQARRRPSHLPVRSTSSAPPPAASAITSSPTCSASTSRAAASSPASLTSTSHRSSGAMVLIPTVPHLVWSAATISEREASTSARFISASIRLGVVNPARSCMPCTPSSSRSRWRSCTERSAIGPTRASEGVRNPPVSATVWSVRALRWNTSATRRLLVTTVRPGTSRRYSAM